MADRTVEIREFCTAWCRRRATKAFAPEVIPLVCRMGHGPVVFGVYSLNYNGNRAASLVLRKAKVFENQRELFRSLNAGYLEGDLIESCRVVVDRIACWEAIQHIPEPMVKTLAAVQREAHGFVREAGRTRNLKSRVEQDIRNFNMILYGNRLAVPMVFELGRAGLAFGLYNDDVADTANRGLADSLLLEQAMSFNDVHEMASAFQLGYESSRQVRFALDHVSHYYTLLDMQMFANNSQAREMISLIPMKPDEAEARAASTVDAQYRTDEPRREYLKLWGIELPLRKDLMPEALSEDVTTVAEISEGIANAMSGVGGGIGKVLKADVGKTAKNILASEIKNPFRSRKDHPEQGTGKD
jgi:hypothetical protein